MLERKELELKQIRLDGGTQVRAAIKEEAVLERDNWKKRRKNSGKVVPLVIAKRRQSNVSKAFVIIQLDEFMELINE